ncbi:diacylglycerol kinase [Klebsiella pneumoniae]|uniref:Diacylglycerol kinase n=4 Tax=Enterobacteriaceae TaxID=543 RepID=A0A447RWZ9_KLEPN|nr:diacylglycerol kinase [Klebsiella pneumoniae]
MANNTTGLTRIIKAAGYSWKGFRAAWINEAAFRQEGVAAIVAVAVACWLDVDAITRVLLIGSVLLVMIVEILNSAIEAVVDRIGSDFSRAFRARQRYGVGGGSAGDYHRADHLGNAAVEPLSLTFFANPRKI